MHWDWYWNALRLILKCTEIDTDMHWDWYWYALRLKLRDAAVIMRGDIVETKRHWKLCSDADRHRDR